MIGQCYPERNLTLRLQSTSSTGMQEAFVGCPTCMDSFPEQMIKKEFTFPSGTQRSIKKLLPIISKEQCAHTDDGGVQPWMHGLEAHCADSHPHCEDSDTDIGSDHPDEALRAHMPWGPCGVHILAVHRYEKARSSIRACRVLSW